MELVNKDNKIAILNTNIKEVEESQSMMREREDIKQGLKLSKRNISNEIFIGQLDSINFQSNNVEKPSDIAIEMLFYLKYKIRNKNH